MNMSIRNTIGLASTAVLLLAGTVDSAHAQREKSLLGVRIWDSRWREVLSKHGQPTRIEVGAVVTGTGESGGGGPMGMPGMGGMGGGSLPGFGGMGPMSGGGGGPMGMPGMGGGMSSGGGKRMGGMAMGGGYSIPGLGSISSGGGRGGLMGAAGLGAEEGGMPGMGGMGGGMPGMGGAAGGQGASSEEEVTWIYERPGKSPVTDMFLFNRDGRLIQVQSFGYTGNAITPIGKLHLGDTIAKIFSTYGWTGNMVKDAAKGTMTLDYGKEKNVAFQLLDRHDGRGYRVVGITVGLTDKRDIPGNRTEDEK